MAAALASRGSGSSQVLNLFRQSIGLLRNLSTASTTPSAGAAGASQTASKKPKRKKKKNLFEVAQFLPNWGIGYHMAKTHWTGVSYQITKINLYKDGKHGKAWGLVHKDGLAAADAPKKISGVHKRCWKYIPGLTNSSGSSVPNSKSTAETAPQVEAQKA